MQTSPEIDEASAEICAPGAAPATSVDIADLGDRLRVTVEIPIEDGEHPSRRRALAKAWEAVAAAISETKAALPPVPAAARPARKLKPKTKSVRPPRTGSGSWWQF